MECVRASGLEKVGGVCGDSNVMNSVERAKEFQIVFNSIRVVEFDSRLLQESRHMKDDFLNRFSVFRKRPRQRASSIPDISTKWVDVNERGVKHVEHCSRLYEKEFERSSSNIECAMFDASAREIMVFVPPRHVAWLALRVRWAIELQFDEQVVCRDWIGELLNSCSEKMRTEGRKSGEKF